MQMWRELLRVEEDFYNLIVMFSTPPPKSLSMATSPLTSLASSASRRVDGDDFCNEKTIKNFGSREVVKLLHPPRELLLCCVTNPDFIVVVQ
jgi:hypothetical protein